MKTFYLLLMAAVITVTSCRTKEGEPGPAGESSLQKQGSVSGSIAYVDANGDSVNLPFNYEYFESLSNSTFTYDQYGFSADFQRRGANDENNSIEFRNFQGDKMNGSFSTPEYFNFNFSTVKNLNNELFNFSSGFYAGDAQSTCEISNFSLDTLSGRLVFDFKSDYDPYDIYSDSRYDFSTHALVKGHVDVTVYRKRYNNND